MNAFKKHGKTMINVSVILTSNLNLKNQRTL